MTSEESKSQTSQPTRVSFLKPLVFGLMWLVVMLALFGFLVILEWVIGHVV